MRLKKIQILGFKSFADKTVLEFDAGITGVVGPNGCGKSNIADAFRWVLGEQSAKSMRGSKMPDVIFAGTTHRKPLNFAEVTITLENSQGLLPIEYAEVAVTRRLHRNGESDYFINSHPVRLKDVQSLFLDSGMGKNAFSIFEQGKIDQVINYTPLERRYIFEEAAGILRFLQRKREALRKLEQADGNMSRVKDIHLEVEKQIIVLEEQAEKARIYKDNKAVLESMEKSVFVAKWDNCRRKSQDTSARENQQKQAIEGANAELEVLQTKLIDAKHALFEGEKVLRSRNEEVFKRRSEKEIKTREKQSNQERLKETSIKEKRWQQDLESMIQRRKERQSEVQALQKQQIEVEKELAKLEKNSKSQREKVTAMDSDVGKIREQHQRAQQESFKQLQAENHTESELKQNTVRLENAQDRKFQLEERRERLKAQHKELAEQVKTRKKQVQDASHAIDQQKKSFVSLEERNQAVVEEIQRLQAELEKLQHEISESRARQKALIRLREEMEGFSAGTKRLLQESANAKSALHGKLKGLYEYISLEGENGKALAAVMRPYAQTLVVETKADFNEILTFATKNKLKDFSLICLEKLQETSGLEIKTPKGISSLLSKKEKNELAIHFLKQVFLADNVDLAWEFIAKETGVELWSQEGAFIDRFQVVFYVTQGENNVFAREAELKNLEKKLREVEVTRLELDTALKAQQQKRVSIQSERLELDQSIRRDEMTLVEINFNLQRVNADAEKIQNECLQIESEEKTLKSSVESLTVLIAELQKKYAEARGKALENQKQAALLASELEKMGATYKHEQRDLQDKEAAYQKVADENRKVVHALNVLEVKDLESKQQEKRLDEEIQSSRELQDVIKNRSVEFEQGMHDVEKSLEEVIAACAEAEKEVTKRKSVIEQLDAHLNQARQKLKQYEGEMYQIGIQVAHVQSAQQSLENELQERYRLNLEEARAVCKPLEGTLEQAEKQIRSLRHQMDAAGDINMTSIEEFDKHKTRYEFLNQQIDDLNNSKQELIQIITQLDGESRKIFKETFEAISANFKKNFRILFNGGEADLQFTETADILEAGIEIIAKPPGKQMRSINLLSGGEKCLTALALLFAIFEVKPAPFCILDEIDAPLDDSNVERFVNVVKQFIDRCQFIIITHNKRTMAIADVLFGVSMEERGVSKLLSIEFSRTATPEIVMAK